MVSNSLPNILPLHKPTVKEFYDLYFDVVGHSEAPRIFHRWCAVSAVSALLGRQCFLPFGHDVIFPNMFVMIMGSPGARKNSAIKVAKQMLERTGFNRFAADRISKEKFIISLASGMFGDEEASMEEEDFVELPLDTVSARYVVAPEFLDFIGKGNIEFVGMLGNLWDNLDTYEHPKIHTKSANVTKPTVNILAGNTPQGFMLAIPPESVGQGFMSRLILVQGDTTGVKITFPEDPSLSARAALDERVARIAERVRGIITISPEAKRLCDRIYREFTDLEDFRFKHYSARRFTHLLKLCLTFAALRISTDVSATDVIQANTLLHVTEQKMSKALGEYGKAKNSDVANSILEIIKGSRTPIGATKLWKHLAQDLNRQEEMQEILKGLLAAGKIKVVAGIGFVPHHEAKKVWDTSLLDTEFLTEEEMQ